jgi:hypothetical protein
MEFTIVEDEEHCDTYVTQNDTDTIQNDLTVKFDYPYVSVTGMVFPINNGSIYTNITQKDRKFYLEVRVRNFKLTSYPFHSKEYIDTVCQNLKDFLNTMEKEKKEKSIKDSQIIYKYPFVTVLGTIINCSEINYSKFRMRIDNTANKYQIVIDSDKIITTNTTDDYDVINSIFKQLQKIMEDNYGYLKEQAKVTCDGSYMKVLSIICPIDRIDLTFFNTHILSNQLWFNFSKTDCSVNSRIYPTEILEIASRNVYEFITKLKLERENTVEQPIIIDEDQ